MFRPVIRSREIFLPKSRSALLVNGASSSPLSLSISPPSSTIMGDWGQTRFYRNWRSGNSGFDPTDKTPTHSGHLKASQRKAQATENYKNPKRNFKIKKPWQQVAPPKDPFVAPKRKSSSSEPEGKALSFANSIDGAPSEVDSIPEPPDEEEEDSRGGTANNKKEHRSLPPSNNAMTVASSSSDVVAAKRGGTSAQNKSVSLRQAGDLKKKMDAVRARPTQSTFYNNSPQLSLSTDSSRTSVSRVFCPFCEANFPDSFEGRIAMKQHIRLHHWDPVTPRSQRRNNGDSGSSNTLLPLFSDSLVRNTAANGAGHPSPSSVISASNVPCNTPVVACPNCGGVFSNFETFYRHLDPRRAFHCRTIQNDQGYNCPYCDDHHKEEEKQISGVEDAMASAAERQDNDDDDEDSSTTIPLPPEEEEAEGGSRSSNRQPPSRPQFSADDPISAVMNHIREKHWGGYFKLPKEHPPFQCSGCFGQFTDFDVYWNHLNTTHFTPAPTFQEKINPIVSEMGKILKQQQQQQQKLVLPSESKFSPVNSVLKGFDTTTTKMLEKNISANSSTNNSGGQLFDCLRIGVDVDCGICTRLFRKDETVYAVRRHYEEHFNEKPRTRKDPFVCPKCGDEFTDFEKFVNHIDWFNGLKCKTLGKPVRCPYCDQLFDSNKGMGAVRKHMLEKHWKASEHRVRDPPFTCNKCGSEFKTFNQLMWHFDARNDFKCKPNHGTAKVLTCPICPTGSVPPFKDEQEAKNHLLEVHWKGDLIQREPPFECHMCGREFVNFSDYVNHFDWKRRGMKCDGGRARRDEEEEEKQQTATIPLGNEGRPSANTTGKNVSGGGGGGFAASALKSQWARTELANGEVIFEEIPLPPASEQDEKEVNGRGEDVDKATAPGGSAATSSTKHEKKVEKKKKEYPTIITRPKYSQTNKRLDIRSSSALLLNDTLNRATLLRDDNDQAGTDQLLLGANHLKTGDSGQGTEEDKEVALIIPDGLSYLPLVPFECPYCPEFESPVFQPGADGLEDFFRHYERVHWDKQNPVDSGQKHKCTSCGEGFWSFDHFKQHLSLRYGVRCRTLGYSVQCPFCPKKFHAHESRMAVRDHLRQHHWHGPMWNRKYPFECVCGAQFVNFVDFWRHFTWKDGGMDCSTQENQWTCII